MNTAKWTLSILLAGCCVFPTLAQAETLYNQTAKAKQLAYEMIAPFEAL